MAAADTFHSDNSQAPFSTILVTGADGFVGRHLAPTLASWLGSRGRLILASGPDAPATNHGTWRPFDLENAQSVYQLVRDARPDLIVHLAAQASVASSAAAARKTWSVNFCGSFALANAIAESAPNCTLLFASSAEVYGRAFNAGPATEATPPEPLSVYARSKLAAEAMLADLLAPTNRLIIARPSNHAGVGQTLDFVLPALARQIAEVERGARPSLSVGNLDSERDFMDVRDVVEAYRALIAHADRLPGRSIFNVASGQVVRIGTLLERLRALSAADLAVYVDPERARPSEIRHAEVNASRLRDQVGWTARHSLDDTIAEVLHDQRRQSIASGS